MCDGSWENTPLALEIVTMLLGGGTVMIGDCMPCDCTDTALPGDATDMSSKSDTALNGDIGMLLA